MNGVLSSWMEKHSDTGLTLVQTSYIWTLWFSRISPGMITRTDSAFSHSQNTMCENSFPLGIHQASAFKYFRSFVPAPCCSKSVILGSCKKLSIYFNCNTTGLWGFFKSYSELSSLSSLRLYRIAHFTSFVLLQNYCIYLLMQRQKRTWHSKMHSFPWFVLPLTACSKTTLNFNTTAEITK